MRVFSGYTGLNGVTIEDNLALRGRTGGFGQGFAFRQQYLRADNINACDFFGDRMLDLNAGIYLDEVEIFRFHIHEKLDRTGAFIAHEFGKLDRQSTKLFALLVR